jgi:hypothetical protein
MVTAEEYKLAEREMTLREWSRGWKIHAAIYGVVITGLTVANVLINTLTDAWFYWFPFPLVGWGIGLAFHYLHGVRRAEREIQTRQAEIEQRAEQTRVAA